MPIIVHAVGRLSVAVLLLVTACSNGPTADHSPPTVVSVTPEFFGVPRNASLVVVFSEPIAPASVSASTIELGPDTGPITGTFTVNRATVTFTPSALLATNTRYYIRVRNVEDVAGNAMEGTYLQMFTTALQ